jgi:hypothetical protein
MASYEEGAKLERWLHDVCAQRYDNFHADPSISIPIDEVKKTLRSGDKDALTPM